jgi:phosphoribosylformylglycinamidine (FGAM) synthase-like enzyme
VKQEKPKKGDKIIQFGGYTGRDGYLGASVSSDGTGAK